VERSPGTSAGFLLLFFPSGTRPQASHVGLPMCLPGGCLSGLTCNSHAVVRGRHNEGLLKKATERALAELSTGRLSRSSSLPCLLPRLPSPIDPIASGSLHDSSTPQYLPRLCLAGRPLSPSRAADRGHGALRIPGRLRSAPAFERSPARRHGRSAASLSEAAQEVHRRAQGAEAEDRLAGGVPVVAEPARLSARRDRLERISARLHAASPNGPRAV
jgi:hypothetical protein